MELNAPDSSDDVSVVTLRKKIKCFHVKAQRLNWSKIWNLTKMFGRASAAELSQTMSSMSSLHGASNTDGSSGSAGLCYGGTSVAVRLPDPPEVCASR